MNLTWYGTAALLLSERDTHIAFDPFFGIPFGTQHPERGPFPNAGELLSVSDVFVTHGHFDHILQIPALYADSCTRVHATETPCKSLIRLGFPDDRLHRIVPNEVLSVGPFTVRTFPSRHCVFDSALVRKTIFRPHFWQNPLHTLRLVSLKNAYPENGEILFYEVQCGTLRMQIMGSMGLDPSVCYPTDADILVLPYQGKSDLVSYGLSLLDRLRPRSVLLDHYDDSFPPLTMPVDTDPFCRTVEEQLGIPCRALSMCESIALF